MSEELIKAAREGNVDKIKSLILQGVFIDGYDNDWNTVLMVAAEQGHMAVIQYYLADKLGRCRHDALNRRDRFGRNALYKAAYAGKWEIADFLVENNASFHISKTLPDTLASLVIRTSTLDRFKKYVQAGMCCHSAEVNGQTPLMTAVLEGKEAFVTYLLKNKKVNVNVQDNFGDTALIHAVRSDNQALAKLLIEQGAMLTLTNAAKQTAVSIAQQGKDPSFQAYLQEQEKIELASVPDAAPEMHTEPLRAFSIYPPGPIFTIGSALGSSLLGDELRAKAACRNTRIQATPFATASKRNFHSFRQIPKHPASLQSLAPSRLASALPVSQNQAPDDAPPFHQIPGLTPSFQNYLNRQKAAVVTNPLRIGVAKVLRNLIRRMPKI